MLESMKRWFGQTPPPVPGWSELSAWCKSRQYALRSVREPAGFVVDGSSGDTSWRLEWGPSQRSYIQGAELRLRADVAVPRELQALVLNRELMESMEKAVFDQYVEGVQTRIDNQTPPEMRWLVMFPKLGGAEMGALKDRYAALGSMKPWLRSWLDGALAAALQGVRVEPGIPFVLMIGRGRLMLRTALDEAEVPQLQMWLRLFEAAMREARRAANDSADGSSQSTAPSLWSPSALPGDERKK